jgi:carboxylate-amine ligase
VRTVGVEEELLLVDIHDGRPRSASGRVLLRAAQDPPPTDQHTVSGSLDAEFRREQLEARTAPVAEMARLESELRHWRARAIALAREAGSNIAALATSPLPVRPSTYPKPRYLKLPERFGITARQHLTCGCHVHVAVESDEEGVGVIDRVRMWLPTVLALSANSPFSEGEDSGYASFRSQAQARWPSNGPADIFGSAAAYHRLVDDMLASEVVLDRAMVYFDVRLSHHLPTVEIRTPDVCLEVADTVLLAAVCRGLVDTAAESWRADEPPPPVPSSLLRLASWQAGRDGVDGQLLDPLTHRPVQAAKVVEQLVEHVHPALVRNGDVCLVEAGVERILTRGSGATRQRRTYARTGRLVDVVAQAVRVTAGHE